MGYRSEVAICFSAEAVKLMTDELKNTLKETFTLVKMVDDGYMLCHDASLKWYDTFDDVNAIEAFMESLDETDNAGCEFLRLGEDDDDNVRKTYGNYHCCRLWLARSVSYSGTNMQDMTLDDEEEKPPKDIDGLKVFRVEHYMHISTERFVVAKSEGEAIRKMQDMVECGEVPDEEYDSPDGGDYEISGDEGDYDPNRKYDGKLYFAKEE